MLVQLLRGRTSGASDVCNVVQDSRDEVESDRVVHVSFRQAGVVACELESVLTAWKRTIAAPIVSVNRKEPYKTAERW